MAMRSLKEYLTGSTVVVVVTLALAWTGAQGQTSPESIGERAAELRAFRDLLRSEDELERIAAFEAGIESDDPVVRKLTFQEGLGSADQNLQSLALKTWLEKRTSIIGEVELPDRPTDAQKVNYEKFAPSLSVQRMVLNENGELGGCVNGFCGYTGQLVPGGLVLTSSNNCALRLSAFDKDTLSGSLGCGAEGHLPVLVKIE